MRRLLPLLLLACAFQVPAQQSINPQTFQALNQATQAQQNRDYGAAQTALATALPTTEPQSLERALVQQRLGYLAIERQRNAEAIDWLRKALAQNQLEPQAASQDRRNLAQLLAQAGQNAEAVRLLEREMAAGTLPLATRQLLVQLYNRLERYAEAIPLAERVVRDNPPADAIWYQLLAGMNYRLQRYSAAEKWFAVLLQREPGNAEYWRQLAGVQSLDRRQAEAAGTLRLAYEGGIRLSETDLENLVALQVAAGAPWQAARLLEELIEQKLLAASRNRSERLARLWQQARDYDRAHQAWAQLARSSGQSEHWFRLAAVQLERGDWTELLESIAQARTGASASERRILDNWADYARRAIEQEG